MNVLGRKKVGQNWMNFCDQNQLMNEYVRKGWVKAKIG